MYSNSLSAEELESAVNDFLKIRQYENITDIITTFNGLLDNFKSLIKENNISLILFNKFHNVTYTDVNIKSITGINCSLLGKAMKDFIHPSDSDLLKNHFSMLSVKALDCTCLNIRIKPDNKNWDTMHCYSECFVDKNLNFYYGIILMNYEKSKDYLELFDKISTQIYKNKMIGILSFIKNIMLKNSA